MRRETAQRLLDARNACLEIESFTSGKSIESMWKERGLQLSLHKLLEIVGEALSQAHRLDSSMASRIPQLTRSVDVRNRIRHGYDSVDYAIVWQVSTGHVPLLVPVIEAILESAPPIPDVP